MNILCYDIENILDQEDTINHEQHTVKKLFYYFNRSCIDGKYVKPYLIRIFLSKPQEVELQWGVNELFTHFNNKLPKYQLQTNVLADYNYIDTNNKQFTIKNQETIDKFSKYEDEAYEFEVNKGNILIDNNTINSICEILETHELSYKFDDDEKLNSIILYPDSAAYHIVISLNGKINKKNEYEISPNVVNYKPSYTSLGKFNMFMGKSTPIPNDDNLAIISTCNHCNKPMIYNWWSYIGTRCPYCEKISKMTI